MTPKPLATIPGANSRSAASTAAANSTAATPGAAETNRRSFAILTNAAEPLRKQLEGIINAESMCKGTACMPIPDGETFERLYNGTCVILADGIRMTEDEMNVLTVSVLSKLVEVKLGGEERLHHILLVELAPPKERVAALMQMVERRKAAGDVKGALALAKEATALRAIPQYTGPDSVVWIRSTGGDIEVADHPLTRDALPELAKLYGQAQALEPAPEALKAAAKAAPSERETMMRNMLTHDFADGCILGSVCADVVSETPSQVLRQQICRHCGFRFPPCDYIPVCSRAASANGAR